MKDKKQRTMEDVAREALIRFQDMLAQALFQKLQKEGRTIYTVRGRNANDANFLVFMCYADNCDFIRGMEEYLTLDIETPFEKAEREKEEAKAEEKRLREASAVKNLFKSKPVQA